MAAAVKTNKTKLVKTKNFFSSIFFGYFSYSTTREFKAHSLYVAVIFRIIQLAIICYVIGWDLITNKSYQSFDPVSATVTTKVKGLGFVQSKNQTQLLDNGFVVNSGSQYKMFDTADYIIPGNEYNSIFIKSNFVQTKQTQTTCDEDPTKQNAKCKTDEDCKKDISSNSWNGIPTGRCINSTIELGTTVCEISAWCPVEIDYRGDKNLIQNIENYTIFIKNDVHFKKYEKRQRNIAPNMTNDYIGNCFNDPVKDPYCPIFRVGDIMKAAEPDADERRQMLEKGGVIQIEIQWNCNLDVSFEKCKPVYNYERFDLKFGLKSAASGFNFRYADKYDVGDATYRNLIKAYGLRFIIVVTGKAGKFDFIPLLITVGSGIGLLAIPVIIADFLLLNLTRKRKIYQELKEYDYLNPSVHEKLANGVHANGNGVVGNGHVKSQNGSIHKHDFEREGDQELEFYHDQNAKF